MNTSYTVCTPPGISYIEAVNSNVIWTISHELWKVSKKYSALKMIPGN